MSSEPLSLRVDRPFLEVSPSVVVGAAEATRERTAYARCKPVIDTVIALVALIVTAPLWMLAALAVRLTSRGPVLFRHRRVGRYGVEFEVLKFRSMCADAEARLHEFDLYDKYVNSGYKLHPQQDLRLTRVGRFLRRTSLDELPQLLNVIRGQMSLVGPRPVVREQLVSDYGELADCYLAMRPGLSGLWQVSGRNRIQFPERAELDRSYLERQSFLLDLGILLRTPAAVVRSPG